MATGQFPAALVATTSLYILYLSLLTIFAIVTVPALALANHSSPPSPLEVYVHGTPFPPDATRVEVATPPGNLTATEFETISVVSNPIRETAAPNSLLLGLLAGQLIRNKDLRSEYAPLTYVLNTTSFAGSISTQGVTQLANGELAIVGGTYDFRFVRGYAELTVISEDPRDRVVKVVFNIKYD